MEYPQAKPRILLITDSRGRGLKNLLNNSLNHKYEIFENILSGSTIETLADWIETETNRLGHLDAVILIGGICNFTSKETYRTCHGQINIIRYQERIDTTQIRGRLEALIDQLQRRLIIATIPPASLIKYLEEQERRRGIRIPEGERGRLLEDLASQQRDLEWDIEDLNKWIIEKNKELAKPTLDFHNQVYKTSKKKQRARSRRVRKFCDEDLRDGVHPNHSLLVKLCMRLDDTVTKTIN